MPNPTHRPGDSFWRDCSGAVILENAITIPTLLLLLVGIMEVGLLFMTATLLESGVGNASRLVRTGQIQGAGSQATVKTFTDKLCASLILVNCANLVVEVREFSTFAVAAADKPVYRTKTDKDGQIGDLVPRPIQFGNANSVVVSRVQYRYSFISPFGTALSGSTDNSLLLQSTAVFKNEPYS